MNHKLAGKKVAILVADGFEQQQMTSARSVLEEAGAETIVVSPAREHVRGWQHDHFGDSFPVDTTVDRALVDEFDALLLPGGVLNPDALRRSEAAVKFVRGFFHAGKPVAAICHGLQTVIEAGVVRDRTLTSYPSVRTDLVNAGANWVDAAVVIDHGLVTSRDDDSLDDFNARMVDEFALGRRRAQRDPALRK